MMLPFFVCTMCKGMEKFQNNMYFVPQKGNVGIKKGEKWLRMLKKISIFVHYSMESKA